jgi:protein AroM
MAEISRWLGRGVEVSEIGAIDSLTPQEIATLAPRAGDYPLVTRLRDGSAVIVAKRHIIDPVQAAITASEDAGGDVALVVCTGEFPSFAHRRPLLMADRLLLHGVAGIAKDARVAVLCPIPEQVDLTRKKWASLIPELAVFAASPYEDLDLLAGAADRIREWRPEFAVMDCMGYTAVMKEIVTAATRVPVLLAQSVVGRLAAEILE